MFTLAQKEAHVTTIKSTSEKSKAGIPGKVASDMFVLFLHKQVGLYYTYIAPVMGQIFFHFIDRMMSRH